MPGGRSWSLYYTAVGLFLVTLSAIFILAGAVAPDWISARTSSDTEVYHGLFEACTITVTRNSTWNNGTSETECKIFNWGDSLSGTGPDKIRTIQAFSVLAMLAALWQVIVVVWAFVCHCRRHDAWGMLEFVPLTWAVDALTAVMVFFAAMCSILFLGIWHQLTVYANSSVSWSPTLIMAGWCIAAISRTVTRCFCSEFDD